MKNSSAAAVLPRLDQCGHGLESLLQGEQCFGNSRVGSAFQQTEEGRFVNGGAGDQIGTIGDHGQATMAP